VAKRQIRLTFPDDQIVKMIARLMAEGDNLKLGGRRIKMLLEDKVERPLNRWIFQRTPPPGSAVGVFADAEGQTCHFERIE